MDAFKAVKDCIEADLSCPLYRFPGVSSYTDIVHLPPPDIASRISSFVHLSNLYDTRSGCWKGFSRRPKSQNAFCSRIATILKKVIHFFDIKHRQVIWEKSKDIDFCFTSHPQLMVVGRRGPSFKNYDFPTQLDYEACATPFTIRLETQEFRTQEFAVQTGIFAQYCFSKQHNRRFVYSYSISETYITLYQFDRHGCVYSRCINYHQFPEIFIRWLIAATSPDEVVLGFNPTIKWRGDRRFMQTLDVEFQAIEFEISPMEMSWGASPNLVGPGTTYWRVQELSYPYIIKEEWRLLSGPREEEFLVAAKGLSGVVQMISYETGEKISALRWGISDPHLKDRQFIRIVVTEHSGRSIEHFQSKVELLHAIRDAISGHRNLWRVGIVHRGINPTTIVYGVEGSQPGNRGVLATLDKATWIKTPKSQTDFDGDHTAFTSLNALRIGNYHHDYLDDLQSFFYVLAWICIAYDGPGKRKSTLPQMLQSWSKRSDHSFIREKSAHHVGFERHFAQNVSPYFGDVFTNLLRDLHNIFWHVKPGATFAAPLPGCNYNPEEIYDRFLSAIDVALSALKSDTPRSTVPPAKVSPPKQIKREKRKRSAELDEIDDFPWKKRLRSYRAANTARAR
ncbi:hypothetical protein AX16_006357 [Volvariella volvacea WC 439]|nr:hypothetical protein AX16_006357 [Volvariella volvacea WC 439]